jgi:hypothetical protein
MEILVNLAHAQTNFPAAVVVDFICMAAVLLHGWVERRRDNAVRRILNFWNFLKLSVFGIIIKSFIRRNLHLNMFERADITIYIMYYLKHE